LKSEGRKFVSKVWLLLTGKWWILTKQLETNRQFSKDFRRLEKGYS